MNYDDEVYGRVSIEDPVILELMSSDAILRLKGVLQHGITGLIGITRETTRFEHSVGTMLLVQIMGGSIEEQIAALMHDVSHTAFSHVIDYVFHGHEEQNYHDAVKEAYISSTNLPSTLAKLGYDWRGFLDEDRFPLLEQPAPALCADRIDYFLRDALGLNIASAEKVAWALSHLKVSSNRIVVDDIEAARWFGYTYIETDQTSWANFREVALYELTAMAIRRGLELGEIQESDFWGTDRDLWKKLQGIDDQTLQGCLGYVTKTTQFAWDELDSDFVVSTKIRTIDPHVEISGEVMSLSSVDSDFDSKRAAYLNQNSGSWPIRIRSS
ncbi:MAG TPA: HD domain-containing protein [candidate division Zixibacteria bacterium]|nr:HD domain-containing protein [candidate division Zixibacteria bacterium]